MRLSPSRSIPRHRERSTPTSDLAADGWGGVEVGGRPSLCLAVDAGVLRFDPQRSSALDRRSARLHWTSAFALGAAACGVHHHASDLAPSRACR